MATSAGSGLAGSAPAIRVWSYGRGLLVHHGSQSALGIDALLSRAGVTGRDSPSYLLVDAGGTVVEAFTVTAWTLQGERGAAFFIVEGNALLKVTVRELDGAPPVVSATPVLAGLAELPPDDTSAQARAAAVIRSDVEATVLRLQRPV
jgi:hypothetical protein